MLKVKKMMCGIEIKLDKKITKSDVKRMLKDNGLFGNESRVLEIDTTHLYDLGGCNNFDELLDDIFEGKEVFLRPLKVISSHTNKPVKYPLGGFNRE